MAIYVPSLNSCERFMFSVNSRLSDLRAALSSAILLRKAPARLEDPVDTGVRIVRGEGI